MILSSDLTDSVILSTALSSAVVSTFILLISIYPKSGSLLNPGMVFLTILMNAIPMLYPTANSILAMYSTDTMNASFNTLATLLKNGPRILLAEFQTFPNSGMTILLNTPHALDNCE